jgi:putative membrane protein
MPRVAVDYPKAMISTARTPDLKSFSQNRLVHILLGLYAMVWIWAAVKPMDRSDWLLENLLVLAAAIFAVWLFRARLISDVGVILAVAFLTLHTVGSHYTYSLVPFGDWLKDVGGFERNHYDRIIHFTFGLLIVYPVRELLLRRNIAAPRWAGFTAFAVIATASGIYELIEWLAAVIVAPELGNAFLGTQGDDFDSQKDHALALGGALLTLGITRLAEKAPASSGARHASPLHT